MNRTTAFLCGFVLLAFALAAEGELTASLLPRKIVFSGVTPGGELVLFAGTIGNDRGMATRALITEALVDSDNDGTVTYEATIDIPFRSIWTGVDVATGTIAVAAPDGYDANHAEISAGAFKHDGEGVAAIEVERFRIDMLLVRPGTGAWIYTGAEGGGKDGDHSRDGRLTALFGDAEAVGGRDAKSPKHLKRGDVVAMLDLSRLELRTLTVTK
jgi:hypothetical protein